MLYFIAGLCVMSLFTILAILCVEEGKDIPALILSGPAMWAWVIVGGTIYRVYKTCALHYFRNHYMQYCFYTKTTPQDTYYIHRKVVQHFYLEGENLDYYVKYVKPCYNAKSRPFPQYIVTPRGLKKYSSNSEWVAHFVREDTELFKKLAKRG